MTPPAAEELAGRRVTVTGAAGFIGAHLCAALERSGAQVTALAPAAGWRPPLADPDSDVRLVALDPLTASATDLAAACAGSELVVHLAYEPPPGADGRAAFEATRNLGGTARLLDALPATVRHLCFASSVMVYGARPPLPVSEDTCPRPATAYAIAKLAAEHVVASWSVAAGVSASVLRLATVFGPGETVPRAIPNFIRRALAGQPPVVRGDGAELRDYVHVDDVVRAFLLALDRERPGHDTLNVASGAGRSTLEVAEAVVGLAGTAPAPTHVQGPAELASIVCDISHTREALGYTPQVDFTAGLRSELRWFAARPDLDGGPA